MNEIKTYLACLVNDERGQDVLEYVLLSGFIAIAAAAVLPQIVPGISTVFCRMNSVIVAATGNDPVHDAAATLK